jgi:hypothetical protein
MTQKLAVAVIHGIGKPDAHFADAMIAELRLRFAAAIGGRSPNPGAELVAKPVLWAPVIQDKENELWQRLGNGASMDFIKLRRFMMDFAADAIAYQPTPHDRRIYDAVHRIVAQALRELAQEAGPTAPLCVIAHSLGTVIASNYIYDLEVQARKRILSKTVRSSMGKTPLDRGETLAALYTLGSPIALWSLRYADFGTPIAVPSPRLAKHHPGLKGEWINFYDQDDIIGYPLKNVNPAYRKAVAEDRAVNVGGLISSWNPVSHVDYWTDNSVTRPVAASLARIWMDVNR